jgi:uncharacterized protein YdaU (DUF1376 family)
MDEKYTSMSDTEKGFYHRCLDVSWVNVGLPSDMAALARLMHVTRKYLDRQWGAVGKCWHLDGDRFYNRTQEEEREHATGKSKQASDAVRSRKDRATVVQRTYNGRKSDDVLRAYDSDSKVNSPVGTKEEKPESTLPIEKSANGNGYRVDATFCEWKTDYEQTGAPFIESDWVEAFTFEWGRLDWEQKLAATKGFRAQRAAGMWSEPSRVKSPKNYLHAREFNRKPVSQPAPKRPYLAANPTPEGKSIWDGASPLTPDELAAVEQEEARGQ